MEHLQQMDT